MTKESKRETGRPGTRKSPARGTDGADQAVEKAIGNRLRAYYDEVAREPVPDRFVELLRRLDKQETKN